MKIINQFKPRMKYSIFKAIVLSFLIFIASSCGKDNIHTQTFFLDNNSMSEVKALDAFAKIFSEAIHDHSDLRGFIKEEAKQMIDMDYDVIYVKVKDQFVQENVTFREILLNYCDEKSLQRIESALPRLTILVPNWEWLGLFSVNTWDEAKSDVAVGFDSPQSKKPLYFNGEIIGELPEGTLPGFPTLIVKQNERIKIVEPTTKSDGYGFDFVDQAYNGINNAANIKTKVEHRYYEITIDGEPDVSDYVCSSELDSHITNAYEEFKADPYAAQRDYLYFDMTKEKTVGTLNKRVTEIIKKIKFNSFNINGLHDEEGDLSNPIMRYEYKRNDSWSTPEQLREVFYAEGGIELVFKYVMANSKGAAEEFSSQKSLQFGDIFAIDKADLDFRHKTWFCKDWYVYTITPENIRSKWCDLNIELPRWDITSGAAEIKVTVEERDSGTEHTTETSDYFKYMTNFSANINLTGDNKTQKNGLGFGNSTETSQTAKYTHKYIEQSDVFTKFMLHYTHPVILDKTVENNQIKYKIKTYNQGDVSVMIVPKYE